MIIDVDYFKNINKLGDILPQHLDNQFNIVSNFLSYNLKQKIDIISLAITKGFAGGAESLFCNLDDNNVGYSYLNDIHFDNGFISLNKLKKLTPSSILVANIDGEINNIECEDDDQLLFATTREGFVFRKINTEDLEYNIISGSKLQILKNDNFIPNIFSDIISDYSISQNNLKNVTNNKIKKGSIGFKHIGIFYDLVYDINIANQILLTDFENLAITSDKILDYTIQWENFIENKPIKYIHLKNNQIVDGHFPDYNMLQQPPNIINENNLSDFGSIINFNNIDIIHNNLKLSSEKLKPDSFKKEHFSLEVQNAIDKYIQIKLDKLKPVQVKKIKPDGVIFLGNFKLASPIAVPNTTRGLTYVSISVAPAVFVHGIQLWFWYVHGFMTNDWIYMNRSDSIIIPLRITDKNLGIYEHSQIYIENVPGLRNALAKYPRSTQDVPSFYTWR